MCAVVISHVCAVMGRSAPHCAVLLHDCTTIEVRAVIRVVLDCIVVVRSCSWLLMRPYTGCQFNTVWSTRCVCSYTSSYISRHPSELCIPVAATAKWSQLCSATSLSHIAGHSDIDKEVLPILVFLFETHLRWEFMTCRYHWLSFVCN